MAAFDTQRVLSVHHWNESLFTFTCTRGASLRFESGHFVMVGLVVEGKPLMRAYSIASAHYEETLEFFSIKVAEGPLTSRLQHLRQARRRKLSRTDQKQLQRETQALGFLPGSREYHLVPF